MSTSRRGLTHRLTDFGSSTGFVGLGREVLVHSLDVALCLHRSLARGPISVLSALPGWCVPPCPSHERQDDDALYDT